MPSSDPASIIPPGKHTPLGHKPRIRLSKGAQGRVKTLVEAAGTAALRIGQESADVARVAARRAAQAAAGGPLGIGAGKRTTEGPRSAAERAGGVRATVARAAARNSLQVERAAARAAARHERLDTAAALLPDMRVAHCQRTPHGGLVEVLYHPDHQAASFGGLQTCGSAWVCPCCAAKIGARRTEEIKAAAASWRARGGGFLMLTLTLQHHEGRQLEDLLDKMGRALHAMKRDRRWKLFANRIGLVGDVVSEEITYGANGWHPHFHILLFLTDSDCKGRYFHERWLQKRWAQVLDDVGEYAREEIGAVLTEIDSEAVDYTAKANNGWGLSAEMAGKEAKQGRKGSLTPSQLLDVAAKGNEKAKRLYQEYGYATKGRHWIRFSKGLRHLCGLEEDKSDEEIANEQTAVAANLVVLTRHQWRMVIGNCLRGELLKIAHTGEAYKVHWWCAANDINLEQWQIECKTVPYEAAENII